MDFERDGYVSISQDKTREKADSFRLLPISWTMFCVLCRTEKVKVSLLHDTASWFLPSFAFILFEYLHLKFLMEWTRYITIIFDKMFIIISL